MMITMMICGDGDAAGEDDEADHDDNDADSGRAGPYLLDCISREFVLWTMLTGLPPVPPQISYCHLPSSCQT